MFYEQSRSSNNYFYISQDKAIESLNFPLHLHKNYEFIYVEEGCMRVEVNTCEFDIKSGEGMLILPNQPHQLSTPDHSKSWLIIFSSDHIPELKKITAAKKLFHPVFEVKIPSLYGRLHEAQGNPLRIRSLLYELAACYCEGEPSPQLAIEDGALVCKIVEYINAHYTEPMTLEEMARALGYSYRYMSGVINQFFKEPLPRVVNQYRVNCACDLLLNTDTEITDIALLCGFGSMRNFNRSFKTVTGITPREYRAKKC